MVLLSNKDVSSESIVQIKLKLIQLKNFKYKFHYAFITVPCPAGSIDS